MFSLKWPKNLIKLTPYVSNDYLKNSLRRYSVTMSSLNKHKIAICQFTCKSDKDENFEISRKLITEAKAAGAKFAFLPEACDYIESSTKSSIAKAEPIDGEFMTKFRKLAAELNIWISIGSFHRKVKNGDDSKLYNSNVILDDQGNIKSINDKIHLFEANVTTGNSTTVLKESDFTHPGTNFYLPLETPIGTIGNCICYDLRFPQISSLLTNYFGAQILTYPSVFTVPTGVAHWEVLLRARAIENQCYVIAAAQVGVHNEKRSSYGYSMVVDPWGKVIANCELESPSFKIAEIDMDYLNQVRQSIPISNSIRSDLYLQLPLVTKSIDSEIYEFGENIKLSNEVVFLETPLCIAFVNLRPVVKGHIVIIPKKLRLRAVDMTKEEAADLFHIGRHIGAKLEKHYEATSINFSIQDGLEAGQSVEHVHLHILPRRKNDFQKDNEIYERLRNHDKEDKPFSIKARTHQEMADEARELRKLFYSESHL